MQCDSNYTNTGKRNANTNSSISTGRIIFFILFNIFYIWGQGGGPVLLIQADFPWIFFFLIQGTINKITLIFLRYLNIF